MKEEYQVDKSKVLVLIISISLFIAGIIFSVNCFDDKGNIKGIYVLLGSGLIAYSLKNFHAIIKDANR